MPWIEDPPGSGNWVEVSDDKPPNGVVDQEDGT